MMRPKLFLDTNICINATNGTIPANEWRRVQKHIGGKFRYQISFVTMKELFGKLARCADEYFEQNKRPLNILFGPGRRKFLPYPSVFALRTVLGLCKVSRKSDELKLPEEERFEFVMTAVLEAPSKAQLRAGIPDRRNCKMVQIVDLDHFDQHENRPQNEYASLLQGIRENRIDMPDPMQWAAWILHQHELTPYSEQCARLIPALDAAYRLTCALSKMTKDKRYNIQSHASYWGRHVAAFLSVRRIDAFPDDG
jgi:hypothetical protein